MTLGLITAKQATSGHGLSGELAPALLSGSLTLSILTELGTAPTATLKTDNTPGAWLYNWNLLYMPLLGIGVTLHPDMKVN